MKSKVHVQVNDYKNKRLLVLESARTLATQLKTYENLKSIRLQKIKKIKQLEKITQDINDLLSQIKIKDFPDVHIKGYQEKISVVEPKIQEQEIRQPKIKLDPITEELQEIERKLASLNL